MYTPKPFNTDNIELPEELVVLTEKIAENVHEVWAKSRVQEGWRYGHTRNDEDKRQYRFRGRWIYPGVLVVEFNDNLYRVVL